VERLQARFLQANTQVLGVSVDSVYCHANWGRDLGGISFPLLADFHPKGEVAGRYGLYLPDAGITDRATVIIDAAGVVRHASSVTPSGERDIEALAALCEGVNREHGQALQPVQKIPGVSNEAALYVKSSCGFSRAALLARDNLHLQQQITVKNVTEDPSAMAQLKQLIGKEQAPCLVLDGKPILESAIIIQQLVSRAAPL